MSKFTLSLLLSCTFLIPNMTFSQDYCPFDFESGLWEAQYYSLFGSDISYLYRSQYNEYAVGDTLMNDSLLCYKLVRTGGECDNYNYDCYAELYTPFTQDLGVICEQDKRIYYNGNLLYDFNVEVGDTIDHWWGIYGWYSPPPTIVSIDSIEVCGKTRKRFWTSQFTLGETYFIEGIGSNAGLIPRYEYHEDGSSLLCYSDQNCEPCRLVNDCEGTVNGPILPGSPCDDGDVNTVNDIYQPDCSCAGVLCNDDAFILEFPANH